jgi:hypothetical protein
MSNEGIFSTRKKWWKKYSCINVVVHDMLLSSLIDSNVSLKWRQRKSKELKTLLEKTWKQARNETLKVHEIK